MIYLSEFCLLCLNSKQLESVLKLDDDGIALQEHLQYCFPEITISKSEIPEFICSSCRTTVHSFCRFRKMSLENYKRYTQMLKGRNDSRGQKFSELQIQINNLDLVTERKQDVDSALDVKEEIEDSLQSLKKYEQRTVMVDSVDTKEDHEFYLKHVQDESTADNEQHSVPSITCKYDNQLSVYDDNFSTDTDNVNATFNNANISEEELQVQVNNLDLVMVRKQDVDSALDVKEEIEDSLQSLQDYHQKTIVDDSVDIEEEFVPDSKEHEFYLKHVKDESTADNEQHSVSSIICKYDNQLSVYDDNFSTYTDKVNTTFNNANISEEELQVQINNLDLVMERKRNVDSALEVKEEIEDSLQSLQDYDQKTIVDDSVDIKDEFVPDSKDHEFYLKYVKDESIADNEPRSVSSITCEDDNQPNVDKANLSSDTDNVNTTFTDTSKEELKPEDHLTQHMKIHTGIRDYKCSVCDKLFMKKFYLAKHMKLHTGIRDQKCYVCDKMFVRKDYLTQHIKTHTATLDHKCSVCDKMFVRRDTLTKHMKSHTGIRDHKCPICDKMFVYKDHLTRHIKIHAAILDHKCSVCDKMFTQKARLTEHMAVHSGIRDYKCSVCDKIFVRKYHLTRHIKTHTATLDRKCSVCDIMFKQKAHLTEHMVVHSQFRAKLS